MLCCSKPTKTFFFLLSALIFAPICAAEFSSSQKFDRHTVHYSVFTSTSISPEIATIHHIKRGKDIAVINIALIDDETEELSYGQPAEVTGAASNLMQQRKDLEFIEIMEPGATYYIATLRFINEEVMHFEINVDPEGADGPYQLKFTKTLYVNP